MYEPPVDLSFYNLSCVEGALSEVPRAGLRPLFADTSGKFRSRALRLSNNSITNLAGLDFTLNYFLVQPSRLGWLDISFNKILHIDPVLCELQELRVLYLHSNCIWNLSEVDKLGQLCHLHTITLHGNTIESKNNYRLHVIAALPQLKKMDFSAVTNRERRMADVWCSNHYHDKTSKENTLQNEC